MNQLPTAESLKESERELLFTIIDVMASEYGWSIEYIQQLELPEIGGLLRAMLDRQDKKDILDQVNIAKAFGGKIGSNRVNNTKRKSEEIEKEEADNLYQLASILKIPIENVKDTK